MESFGITIVTFIIIAIIVAIIKGIGNSAERAIAYKKYDKAVDNSNGLEKIRLLVRREGNILSLKLKKTDGTSSWPNIFLPVSAAYLYLTDSFYGSLKDFFEKMGDANAYDELAQAVATDYEKEQVIAARIFGIAFGITVAKAANTSKKKVKKTSVKKYLDSCNFNDSYRNEITKAASTYINFEQDELFGARSEAGFTSHDLGELTYSLLDMKLGKDNYADLTYATHMAMAIAFAYREIIVDDRLVSDLQQEGLIG